MEDNMKRALIALLLIISFLQAGITFGTGSKVNFGNANVGIYGNLKNLGAVTYLSTSKLSFIGSAQDTITNITVFPNLIVNKPAGNVRLNNSSNNFLLSGNITFTKGNIITGTNTFELGSTATVAGESIAGYIAGTVKSARLIGTGTSAGTGNFGGIGYVINNTGSDLGTVTVNRYSGDGSEVVIYGSEGIWRKWTVQTSNIFSGTRSVTSSWLSSEDNANNLTALKVWKYEPVKSSDEDNENNDLRKLVIKNDNISTSKSNGIEGSDNTIRTELESIVVEPDAEGQDPKNLYWVEVDGSTFSTASSPRTTTYTINAATTYTVCSASNTFADGAGTVSNPYQVATLTQLDNVRNYPTACFIQIANIDASATSGWNAGAGWLPIGNSTTKFTGRYNGQGYTVSGLYINRSATSYNGLFGYAQGSIISNVKLTGLNIIGGSYTGGLSGYNYTGATITGCSTDGVITGTNYVGGLVGRNESSSIINNSLSKGTVTGLSYVGGLAGLNYITCEINNSYSQANVLRVSGGTSTYVAGFTSYNYTSKIINSYSTGSVTYIDATNPTNKGFVAYISTGTGYAMTGDFWNTETSGQTSTAGTATGLTKNQMRTLSIFTTASWDFQGESVNGTSDIWGINAVLNSGYPFLSWEGITHSPSPFAGGIGTASEPFLVSNLTQLDAVRGFMSYQFRQTADIDATPTSGWKSGGWLPIGNATTKFTGIYNGQGYNIDGLVINRPATNYNGLFGYAQNSSVSNLVLTNVSIIGATHTGGLIGYNYTGSVTNCSSTGTVTGSNYVGGLVGWNSTSSMINNCFSKGSVTGFWYVGGFTGVNQFSCDIRNSYSQTNVVRVSGSTYTDFAGFCPYIYDCKVINCYSTGSVVYTGATNPTSKGFGSYLYTGAYSLMTGNYWNLETSNQATSGATATGITSNQMRTLSTFTAVGWDFVGESVNGTNDYWNIHPSLNSGYPYLNWEYRLAVEAPANLALTISGTDVIITWDPVTNATGYAVYSSTDPYGTFVLDETGSFNGTEWTDAMSGTKYFYYVTATNNTKIVLKEITVNASR
jgi:hypothetical protein